MSKADHEWPVLNHKHKGRFTIINTQPERYIICLFNTRIHFDIFIRCGRGPLISGEKVEFGWKMELIQSGRAFCRTSQSQRAGVVGHGLHHDGRARAEAGGLRVELSISRTCSWFGEESSVQEHVSRRSLVPAVFVDVPPSSMRFVTCTRGSVSSNF